MVIHCDVRTLCIRKAAHISRRQCTLLNMPITAYNALLCLDIWREGL